MSEHIPHVPSPVRLRFAGMILAVVAAAVAAVGILMRTSNDHDLQKEVESQHVTVKVVMPEFGSSEQTSPGLSTTARARRFSSSRTFPGQS